MINAIAVELQTMLLSKPGSPEKKVKTAAIPAIAVIQYIF